MKTDHYAYIFSMNSTLVKTEWQQEIKDVEKPTVYFSPGGLVVNEQ